jgi:serine/threonine protein kinase
MELSAGGDLFDRIVEHQHYSELDARRVMRRLLSALYYLHEHCNIVHRDLKPENILCTSPTHVKLADFGLAKIMKDDGLKTFCGTPQYFAPEVLQRRHTVAGEGRYGKPADMWSLGVIFYILLTGKPPFGADMDEPQPYHLEFEDGDDSSIWKSMPLAQELVQQLLRHDPKRRLSVGQACDHPWINIDDGDTHIHPLDDPAVTARKRLFSDKEEDGDGDDTASMIDIDDEDEETNSTISKEESVLSKEEFAAAAVSHQRTDSFFDCEDKECKNNIQEGGVQTKMSVDGKDETKEKGDQEQPTSTSPEAPITTAESSVTPDDCDDCSLPRSPLEAMNLNDRSNRFREHVLQHNNNNGSPTESRPSTNSQAAVTPNVSNVTKQSSKEEKEQHLQLQPVILQDEILSQFSSEPSSLESFADSPAKKRSLQEIMDQQPPEAKRQKKHIKQTTLSSWFVKTTTTTKSNTD